VFRKENRRELLCAKEDNLLAVATNQPVEIGVPCFGLDDAQGLVGLIEEKFLRAKGTDRVRLKVNGKEIALSPFVKRTILGTVRGMVSSLKGCEEPESLEIQIKG
jgi:hypothetical protein